jgi:hypothetical protein
MSSQRVVPAGAHDDVGAEHLAIRSGCIGVIADADFARGDTVSSSRALSSVSSKAVKRSLARSKTECTRHLPPDSRASRPAFATDVASTRRTGRPLAAATPASREPAPIKRQTSRSSQSAELRSRLRSATFDNEASPIASAHAAVSLSPRVPQQ